MSERSPSGSSGASSRTSAVLSAASERTTSTERPVLSAISSGVGSRRSSWRSVSALRVMRERSAVRLSGTRTVRPVPGQRGQDRLADPPDRVGDELDALVGIEFPGSGEQPEVALADQVAERQAPVLVLLGDRDDEAQVALDQLLHGLGVAGPHQPGDGHFLLRREQRGLADLEEILVEDVAIGIVHAEILGALPPPRPPGLDWRGLGEDLGDREVIGTRVGDCLVYSSLQITLRSSAVGLSRAMCASLTLTLRGLRFRACRGAVRGRDNIAGA